MCGEKRASLIWNGLIYGAALAVAVGLKYNYSTAGCEQLHWMLTPLARLVGFWTGIRFEWESHAGFVATSAGIVIAPACAGVNFVVICFSALFFTLAHRGKRILFRLAWLPLSLSAAYGATLLSNTIRIISSMYLYRADIYGAWITPERVHRLNGVVIYACFLLVVYLLAERLTRRLFLRPRHPVSAARLLSVPFLWYILITIFVPLMGSGSLRGETPFLEHAIVIVAAIMCLFVLCLSCTALYHKRVDRSLSESENNRNYSGSGIETGSKPDKETGELP